MLTCLKLIVITMTSCSAKVHVVIFAVVDVIVVNIAVEAEGVVDATDFRHHSFSQLD